MFEIFQELAAVIMMGVHLAADLMPNSVGADKKAAVTQFVTTAVAGAEVGSAVYANTQAAIASGNQQVVDSAISQGVEAMLSAAKAVGFFPKAAIVQNAPDLATLVAQFDSGAS